MRHVNVDGTGFRGVYLDTPLQKLVDKFGNENISEPTIDGKVTHEWAEEVGPKAVITIYDWKNPPTDEDNPHRWNIGGKGLTQEEIKDFLLRRGFDEFEIVLDDSPIYKKT